MVNQTDFKWTIENNEAFQKSIDKLGKATNDFRIPFRIISSDFYRSQRKLFTNQGAGLYTDLSTKPFTAYWEKGDLNRHYSGGYKEYKKAKVGFTYPILVGGTKDLANSTLGRNHKYSIYDLGKRSLKIGTNVPYGKFHQSDEPRSKLPQRKFIFIDGGPADKSADSNINGRRERWTAIIDTHVEQLLTGRVRL